MRGAWTLDLAAPARRTAQRTCLQVPPLACAVAGEWFRERDSQTFLLSVLKLAFEKPPRAGKSPLACSFVSISAVQVFWSLDHGCRHLRA